MPSPYMSKGFIDIKAQRMQTVMVYNEKGGVGKTTLSAQIGTGLAILGYKYGRTSNNRVCVRRW